jgi:hypothetical protein
VSGTGRDDRRRRGLRRSTPALLLAGIGIVCAIVAALAPAHHLRSSYSWPPKELPAAKPDRLWYAPLLLTRQEPASISSDLPCRLPPPLPRASRPAIVLATARHPGKSGGLAVTRRGDTLVVSVGPQILTSLDIPTSRTAKSACTYHLEIAGGIWTISGGSMGDRTGGATMPVVDGVFSGLDLSAERAPSIAIETTVFNSRTTGFQTVVRILGALSALTALLLVALGGRRRRAVRTTTGTIRTAVARARPVDGVVVLLLAGWWVIGPAFFDDGWIMATQRNFAASGSFTSYYDSFGVTLSLQYWLEWSESWLFRSSHSLLALRLPALVCLTATWVLCRWIFGRILAAGASRSAASLWALAGGFLVGAFAWGMTLRPEPVLALLVTAVLACTVRFLERASVAPLAAAAVLVALAISAHPAGLVALAPLLVAAPQLVVWARSGLARAGTIAGAAVAIFGILVVLGSDLAQLRADAASLRTYGPEIAGWREELSRYTLLSRALYGAPLRREWAALALLGVFAYLLRRRDRSSEPLLDLPAKALGVSLLLLLATPSKLPWHFGTLIGFAALVAGTETTRLITDARSIRGWHIRPFLIIGATMLAAAWSWFPRNSWSELDLRTLSWTLGIEQRITFAKAAGLLPLVLLAVFAVVASARSGPGGRLRDAAWRASIWSVPLLAVPLIAFTAGVLVADAIKTNSWTLTRQNMQTLRGNLRCGLADDALVPLRSSMRALAAVTQPSHSVAASWLPPAPIVGLVRFQIGPPPTPTSAARSSWFRLTPGQKIGFFLTGTPGTSDLLELEWGSGGSGGIQPLGAERVQADFASDAEPDRVAWRFYSARDLPSPPPGATAVRFVLRADHGAGTQIGLTAAVTYRDERLITLLKRRQPSLALPNLLAYVPCVKQPVVTAATEAPKAIVAFRDSLWPLAADASPFAELSDIYSLVRLPLSDSPDPPGAVAVYEVDQQIEGGVSVPAVQRRST